MKKVICRLNISSSRCSTFMGSNGPDALYNGKNEAEKAAMFKEAIVR
ncbi:MAG: hypothetical protein IKO93_13355 [Lentisphaeria bacterium]|nr:hypothetical protein [Lentisphaeria bacterium]